MQLEHLPWIVNKGIVGCGNVDSHGVVAPHNKGIL